MTVEFKAAAPLAALGDLANLHRQAIGETPLTQAMFYERGRREDIARATLSDGIDRIGQWVVGRRWTATIIALVLGLAAGKLAASGSLSGDGHARRYKRR